MMAKLWVIKPEPVDEHAFAGQVTQALAECEKGLQFEAGMDSCTTGQPRWLDDDQRQTWMALVGMMARLPGLWTRSCRGRPIQPFRRILERGLSTGSPVGTLCDLSGVPDLLPCVAEPPEPRPR